MKCQMSPLWLFTIRFFQQQSLAMHPNNPFKPSAWGHGANHSSGPELCYWLIWSVWLLETNVRGRISKSFPQCYLFLIKILFHISTIIYKTILWSLWWFPLEKRTKITPSRIQASRSTEALELVSESALNHLHVWSLSKEFRFFINPNSLSNAC